MVALHITCSALGENKHLYFNDIQSAIDKLQHYKRRAIDLFGNNICISHESDTELYFDTEYFTERYYIEEININN